MHVCAISNLCHIRYAPLSANAMVRIAANLLAAAGMLQEIVGS
jgi:hypothetical protein